MELGFKLKLVSRSKAHFFHGNKVFQVKPEDMSYYVQKNVHQTWLYFWEVLRLSEVLLVESDFSVQHYPFKNKKAERPEKMEAKRRYNTKSPWHNSQTNGK